MKIGRKLAHSITKTLSAYNDEMAVQEERRQIVTRGGFIHTQEYLDDCATLAHQILQSERCTSVFCAAARTGTTLFFTETYRVYLARLSMIPHGTVKPGHCRTRH